MSGGIFISYRRDDSKADARSIYQHLSRALRRYRIFIDVDAIPKGRDFRVVLEDHLRQSEVMLAVIGPRWLTVTNERGQPRIADPDDVVRLEIATALARDIAVIPVLVEGARMPKAADLPDDLKPLERRHGSIITHENFSRDMDGLVQDIRRLLSPRRSWVLVASAAGTVLAAAFALHLLIWPTWLSWQSAPNPVPKPGPRAALLLDRPLTLEEDRRLAFGDVFAECKLCPRMIVVPAGEYRMGSPDTENGRSDAEGPVQKVAIARAFAVGVTEITIDQYAEFVSDAGHDSGEQCMLRQPDGFRMRPGSFRNPGFAVVGSHPAACVSWHDAKAYVHWLAEKTGKPYRLLSEAEWEYAARGGSSASYWFGDDENHLCTHGNVADQELGSYLPSWTTAACNDGFRFTAPAGQFRRNSFGLYDVTGNVWEWTADCWREHLRGTPADGTASELGDCSRRVMRGGSWASFPRDLRSAARTGIDAARRSHLNGIRVGRAIVR